MADKTSSGKGDAIVATRATPALQAGKASIQCRCPFCGGCFDPDDEPVPPASLGYNCTCVHCGHNWRSRVEDPSRCPRCGTYKWRDHEGACGCRRCGYEWYPRSRGQRPGKCPSCRAEDWDAEVVRRRWIMKRHVSGEGCLSIASGTGIALLEVIDIVRDVTGEPCPRLRSLSTVHNALRAVAIAPSRTE